MSFQKLIFKVQVKGQEGELGQVDVYVRGQKVQSYTSFQTILAKGGVMLGNGYGSAASFRNFQISAL